MRRRVKVLAVGKAWRDILVPRGLLWQAVVLSTWVGFDGSWPVMQLEEPNFVALHRWLQHHAPNLLQLQCYSEFFPEVSGKDGL